MTTEQVLKLLRAECEAAGSQREWARWHKVSGQYVGDVLRGRVAPSFTVLNELGLERVVRYRKKGTGNG